jgi:hypothetical protein
MTLGIIRASDMPEPEPIDCSKALPARELSWERIVEIEPRLRQAEKELSTPHRLLVAYATGMDRG